MNVGIDLSITRINQAGTGIYAKNVAAALQGLEQGPRLHVFAVNQHRDMSSRKTLNSRLHTLYRDLIWTHMLLPYRVRRMQVDVLHMPANIMPVVSLQPTVVTILDTTIFRMPEYFPTWYRTYATRLIPRAARQARIVLTISEQSKDDIVTTFRIDPDKVVVTPLAASAQFQPVPQLEITAVKQTYGLDHFVLSVGTLEPRKNMVRLLQSLALLKQSGRAVHLVHCGPKGWLFDGIMAEVDRLDLRNNVQFLGRVPINDLVGLYNAADAFVYPSTYEGFGLPVLEAMQCGCPVITSNISSLPEVTGDAAILVDPYSVDQLADAIKSVITDRSLAEQLRIKGRTRASAFSWEACARRTFDAYKRAVSQ